MTLHPRKGEAMTFEQWWTEPDPQTGRSYEDVLGVATGIVRLAYAAGQRAEREACARAIEAMGHGNIRICAAAIRKREGN